MDETNIHKVYQCMTLLNLPKLLFFGLKIYHLATLHLKSVPPRSDVVEDVEVVVVAAHRLGVIVRNGWLYRPRKKLEPHRQFF
jgi:hypothetical protein